MSLTVTLAGTEVGLRAGTLSIEDTPDERDVARLTIDDPAGVLSPTKGQSLVVSDGGTVIFRGFVEDPTTERVGTGPHLLHQVSAVDGHYLVDKRRAAIAYEGETVQAIVTDLHARYLDEEGVVLGTVDPGPTVELIVFNWVTVAEALSELAELAGFWWYVASTATGFELEFRSRDAFAAPFPVSAADMQDRPTPMLRGAAPDYRNVQYIRGVRDKTDPQTETFQGDGETRTFTVAFRVAQVPTVEVNSSGQTVGIRGVDEGFDFYWNKDDRTISQDSGATPLTSSDTLSVTYVGFFDAVVRSENQDAIDDRATVEGGTGKVEHVVESRGLEGRAAAFDLAAAKLDKFGQIGKTVEFVTRTSGLRAGHLLPVTHADYSLDAEMLVSRVEIFDHAGVELRYQVTAVEGPHEEAWSRFFARLHEAPDVLVWRDNISEDEILTLLFPFSKTWEETDAQPANFWFEVWPADDLATSTSLYPQIDRDDWMLYVEWWDATSPLGRKQVTSRSLTADEIESTFYLGPFEASTTIAEVKFYSGIGATAELESGDVTATETVGDTKTAAEAWQITRDDTRSATPADWWVIGDEPV